MYDIGRLLDTRFVRDLLNVLSISLGVQCAVLDRHGRVFMLADRPVPPNRLPYDVSLVLLQAGFLDSTTQKKWIGVLRDAIVRARNSCQAHCVKFQFNGLKWVQYLAPLIAGKSCIGFMSSGKIPLGDRASLVSIPEVSGRKVKRGSQKKLSRAMHSTGVLPEGRIKDRLSMVIELARAASRIATQNLRSSGIAGLPTVKARLHVEVLDEIIRAINRGEDEDSILHVIIGKGFKLLGADRGTLHIWDSSQNRLIIKAGEPKALCAKVRGFAHPVDKGICGWVFRNKKPALVHDLRTEKEWSGRYLKIFHKIFPKPRTISELAVPLITSEGAIGVLNVESGRPNAFADEHVEILKTLANHAVVALHKTDLLRTKERQLLAFANTTSKLGPLYSLSDTLDTIVQQATIALRGSVGSLKLYDDRSEALSFRAICSFDGKRLKWDAPFRVWVQEGGPKDSVSAWVFRDRQARLTSDTQKEDLWNAPPWPARSGVHVPLLAGKRPVGVLAVDSPMPNAFKNSDLRVLELLATEVVVAVENAWHDELMRRISSLLTRTLEVRMDEEPSKHRITVLSQLATIVWEVMKPKACSVIVPPGPDDDQRFMRIPEGCEYGIDRTGALPLPKGKGLYGATIRTGRIQESKNVMSDKRFADTALARRNGLTSALSVPIRKNGQSYGALNYYSSFEREFSEFERHSLKAICGIAGMIISATEAETHRRRNILNQIGTGVTLIGLPPDWDKRMRAREKGNTDWNLDIKMPILFLNRIHAEMFAPKAKIGMDCYKGFNEPAQRRPCWWCPTIRAMFKGEPKTSFTHSPAPPKNRMEHFKVTASILKEGDKPVAAIESTVPATRELEGRNLSACLLETNDEDEVFRLAVECLGRGTRNDCILFISMDEATKDMRVEQIYTVDKKVWKEEYQARPEWTKDTLRDDFPPLEEYFTRREEKGRRLFKKRPRHRALRGRLSACAKEIIWEAMKSGEVFFQIRTEKLLEFFRGTKLLNEKYLRHCDKTHPPRAVILRIGPKREPVGCLVMLDKKPGQPCFEEPGHGRHWCIEIASELATKISSIRLTQSIEQLAQFRETIIEQAPVGVLVTDSKGKVTRVNSAWRSISGGDITGRYLLALETIKNAGLVADLKRALKGQKVSIPEIHFRSTFGKELVLSIKVIPMFNESGRISGLLISCWDMTALAKKHEELIIAREESIAGNLASGAAHEMLNPGRTVENGAQWLGKGILELLQAEHRLSNVPFSGQELGLLRVIVKSLLKYTRPGAGPLPDSSESNIKEVKALIKKWNLSCRNVELNRLARFEDLDEIGILLESCGSKYAKPVFSYFVKLTGVIEVCSDIAQSIMRINEVVEALESQSFLAPRQLKKADIHNTIDAAFVILRRDLDESGVTRKRHFSSRMPKIRCIPGQLSQMWRNIFQNSLHSLQEVKRQRKLSVLTRRSFQNVIVTIEDNGRGIPAGVNLRSLGRSLPELEKGETHGYGLWIARKVAEDHKGSLTIKRLQNGNGTRVVVSLPINRR
jgi:PAS domain S-box-containing protein